MARSDSNDTEHLLLRASLGDIAAKTELLDRHREHLRRMIVCRLDRRIVSRLDPSDVVQEALSEAAQKLSDYLKNRPVPFYPWLKRLAWEHLVRLHGQHLDARRRSVKREISIRSRLSDESASTLLDGLAASDSAPDTRLLRAEMKLRLMTAIAQLPESDREILVLRFLEHLPVREIAAILKMSEGAVRTRQTRALSRLAELLPLDSSQS